MSKEIGIVRGCVRHSHRKWPSTQRSTPMYCPSFPPEMTDYSTINTDVWQLRAKLIDWLVEFYADLKKKSVILRYFLGKLPELLVHLSWYQPVSRNGKPRKPWTYIETYHRCLAKTNLGYILQVVFIYRVIMQNS